MKNLEQYKIGAIKWNSMSIKERLEQIKFWEEKDGYPYGHSNSRKKFERINSHYLKNNIMGLR